MSKQLRLPSVPIPVEQPVARNNGKYQFCTGYTGGGAMMCEHLTKEEIEKRLEEQAGPGRLEDDGKDLWWIPN